MLERLDALLAGQESWNSTIAMRGALERTEPPIRVELMTYGLRNPRCTQCFREVRVAVDQSCPFERIEELIEELRKLAECCPKCPKGK